MNDQARALRESILKLCPMTGGIGNCHVIVLLSGKGGVGTTTVGVNLAVAMAGHHRRVCLFDADATRFDVAHRIGLADDNPIRERIHPRQGWQRHVVVASAGVRVASASQFLDSEPGLRESSSARLARRLMQWELDFDVLLVDVGCQSDDVIQAWTETAAQIVVVTTSETVAILNTYSLLKRLRASGIPGQTSVILNQVFHSDQARMTEERLSESTRRFLGYAVRVEGQIPYDVRMREQSGGASPVVLSSPKEPAAVALERLAERFSGHARLGRTHHTAGEPIVICQKISSERRELVEDR